LNYWFWITSITRFKFLKCNKILSQCHHFLSFLHIPFLPCKKTFMNDYDEIKNYNALKYSPLSFFDNFWFINFYGDWNIKLKRIVVRTRPFSSYVVHLKGFSPYNEHHLLQKWWHSLHDNCHILFEMEVK